MNDHSASRRADVLEDEAPDLIGASLSDVRRKALEEIVEITLDSLDSPDISGAFVRIRELARLLHSLEPVSREAFPRITGDAGHDNAVRSRAALLAVAGWPHLGSRDLTAAEELEEALGDLVCDLFHLARRGGANVQKIESRARRHFTAELLEEAGAISSSFSSVARAAADAASPES